MSDFSKANLCESCGQIVSELEGRAERLERNLRYIAYHRNALGQRLIELLPEERQQSDKDGEYKMKCDNCVKLLVEQPSKDEPYGFYGCSKGHWSGCERMEQSAVKRNDPWKFCKDYEANI